jgi:uncharacterized protein YndB with AHSA1/START domain
MERADERATVRLTIDIDVPVERAYQVFTQRFDLIKPREHKLFEVDIAESVLEPWVGGRLYDRGRDGRLCQWGRVLAVDPPHRIAFSWDISPSWQLEDDPDRASEVELRFTPVTPQRTRVDLEHRHLDRHGPGWEAERDSVAGYGGWPLYLRRYRDVLATS